MPNPGTQTTDVRYDDEIDLRVVVATLLSSKWLILSLTAVGIALGAILSLSSTRYVADGLFLTPELQATDYKRYEQLFTNARRLETYLVERGLADTEAGISLANAASGLEKGGTILTPEFSLTERDLKSFGVTVANSENMLGVRLRIEQPAPNDGAVINLLSEYVRDSIAKVDLEGAVLASCNKYRTRDQEIRNEQLQSEFLIAQEESRFNNLRDIVARNSDADAIDARQIVSLEKGNERYLSPKAQLVATEIHIADLKLAEATRERERVASAIKGAYYCEAQRVLPEAATSTAALQKLKEVQASVFMGYDKSIEVVERVWNELDVERQKWHSKYLVSMRFVAPAQSLELEERKPSIALGLTIGALLGLALGVFLALTMAWWRNGKT